MKSLRSRAHITNSNSINTNSYYIAPMVVEVVMEVVIVVAVIVAAIAAVAADRKDREKDEKNEEGDKQPGETCRSPSSSWTCEGSNRGRCCGGNSQVVINLERRLSPQRAGRPHASTEMEQMMHALGILVSSTVRSNAINRINFANGQAAIA